MEQYLIQIASFLVIFCTIGAFVYRYWTGFGVIYKCAKSAFWMVEEVARKKGLISEEKSKLFIEKFKSLMKWAGRWVTKKNLKLALDFADEFCAKYRDKKQPKPAEMPSVAKKEHIKEEEKPVVAKVELKKEDLSEELQPLPGAP